MSLPFWSEQPEAWDTVYVKGIALPGACTVQGKKQARRDIRQTPGSSGTSQTHLGYDPAEVHITLRMWKQEHWDEFARLLAELQPLATKKDPQPVEVVHPALAVYGLSALYLESFSTPDMGSVRDVYHVVIRATEWDPVRKRNETHKPTQAETSFKGKGTAIPERKRPSDTETDP